MDGIKDFSGLEDWFEVFPTGRHKDNNGHVQDWTEADLDKILSATSVSNHEAPLVIGHPKDNAPAYGWLSGLKKEDGKLFAKGKDIYPEFNDMVKTRRFPKRSISLYPDYSVRHIAFLGAKPPAIKGMPDVQFSDNAADAVTIEFGESWAWRSIADVFRNLREWFIGNKDKDTADQLIPEYLIQSLQDHSVVESQEDATAPEAEAIYSEKEENRMDEKGNASKQFSEADVEKITKDAHDLGKREAVKEFAEQERQGRIKDRKKKIADFCESLQKKGNFKLLPAIEKLGVKQFMEQLAEIDETVEFSEGGKQTMIEWFEGFLAKALPDRSDMFTEHAKRGDAVEVTDDTQRDKIIRDFMEDHKDASYKDAVIEVSKSHPKLFERR